MKQAFSVCVYCGSRTGATPEFATLAREVGRWIGAHDGQLVYGGGNTGLMGAVADATLESGGRVVDRHGRPLGQLRALFRYACCWLWVLPPLAFVAPMKTSAAGMFAAVLAWIALLALASNFQPQRQFWHDVLAGTRLVSAPSANK